MKARFFAVVPRVSVAAAALTLASACQVNQLDALNRPADDAPADASTDATSADSDKACMVAGPPVLAWTFDTSDDSWLLTSEGTEATMSLSSATGNPTPGALQVDFTGLSPDAGGLGATTWVHAEVPAIDLTDRTASAWVRLNRGASPQFLFFAQTKTAYAWADNGESRLPLGSWTCVSLPISSAVDAYAQYDPTEVIRIGFEMIATEPFQLLIDSVRVQ